MSITTSFTDKGECIYDESGEILLTDGSEKKVLRECDMCGDLEWMRYVDIVNSRADLFDFCHSCSNRVFFFSKDRW